mmetsp:Transcript_3884/g.6839  ORF Transcript_3884/g.6839 Transcript_3884/m.6839 type:complete len:125 (-) Transcript_3884:704-1078(-)
MLSMHVVTECSCIRPTQRALQKSLAPTKREKKTPLPEAVSPTAKLQQQPEPDLCGRPKLAASVSRNMYDFWKARWLVWWNTPSFTCCPENSIHDAASAFGPNQRLRVPLVMRLLLPAEWEPSCA